MTIDEGDFEDGHECENSSPAGSWMQSPLSPEDVSSNDGGAGITCAAGVGNGSWMQPPGHCRQSSITIEESDNESISHAEDHLPWSPTINGGAATPVSPQALPPSQLPAQPPTLPAAPSLISAGGGLHSTTPPFSGTGHLATHHPVYGPGGIIAQNRQAARFYTAESDMEWQLALQLSAAAGAKAALDAMSHQGCRSPAEFSAAVAAVSGGLRATGLFGTCSLEHEASTSPLGQSAGISERVQGTPEAKAEMCGLAAKQKNAPRTGAHRAQSAEKEKAPSQRRRLPPDCKWFMKGTCKFGAECRYIHKDPGSAETSTSPQKSRNMGSPCERPADSKTHKQEGRSQSRRASSRAVPTDEAEASSSEEVCSAQNGERVAAPGAGRRANVQFIWCDQRAFKEDSHGLRVQLEAAVRLPAKSHKTAEKCIRLLQKKRRALEKAQAWLLSLFLVSWTNAPALVQYLAEATHVTAAVVVLCDTCSNRVREAAEAWAGKEPAARRVVKEVCTTWPQALDALRVAATKAAEIDPAVTVANVTKVGPAVSLLPAEIEGTTLDTATAGTLTATVTSFGGDDYVAALAK